MCLQAGCVICDRPAASGSMRTTASTDPEDFWDFVPTLERKVVRRYKMVLIEEDES